MELLQLQYFLLLAKEQHVTKTAELLHISSPPSALPSKSWKKSWALPFLSAKDATLPFPLMARRLNVM